MTIYQLLQKSTFDPEEVRGIAAAYEETLKALRVTDKHGPEAEVVARKIIDIAGTGELDPTRMRRLVLAQLGFPSGQSGEPIKPGTAGAGHSI